MREAFPLGQCGTQRSEDWKESILPRPGGRDTSLDSREDIYKDAEDADGCGWTSDAIRTVGGQWEERGPNGEIKGSVLRALGCSPGGCRFDSQHCMRTTVCSSSSRVSGASSNLCSISHTWCTDIHTNKQIKGGKQQEG